MGLSGRRTPQDLQCDGGARLKRRLKQLAKCIVRRSAMALRPRRQAARRASLDGRRSGDMAEGREGGLEGADGECILMCCLAEKPFNMPMTWICRHIHMTTAATAATATATAATTAAATAAATLAH
ncbi:hypothetical protein CDD81_2527 [Ophiocordyceps australis]|uniref:Uncharacterized protein n=1 Tax=Ophiocordyceps australis TaxID=1399860 RepID=A0A2C5YCS2_9HYPO|nr:hypothetical protein CDD81_2527 [Ophiocordyceps australis]